MSCGSGYDDKEVKVTHVRGVGLLRHFILSIHEGWKYIIIENISHQYTTLL
jgi:hypothetical protein